MIRKYTPKNQEKITPHKDDDGFLLHCQLEKMHHYHGDKSLKEICNAINSKEKIENNEIH